MKTLSLALLGPFQAGLNGRPLTQFRSNRVQALLIYLAVESHFALPRETLMELLWPGLPLKSAQVNLRQTLYQLRKLLSEKDAPEPLLLTDRKSIRFSPDAHIQLDIDQFTQLLRDNPGQQQLEEAAAIFRGDFLCDFFLPDSAPFEEWGTTRRVHLRQLALDGLDNLVTLYMQQEMYDEARIYAQRLLAIDNLHERGHRQLMEILVRLGQRGQALAQYEALCQLLQEELGANPSAKTEALYQQIQRAEMGTAVQRINRVRGYELLQEIGGGGFGVVYLGLQSAVNREVAIKIIAPKHAEQPEFIRRFAAEAHLVARLEHPHIVPLYDFWLEPDGTYLVMRFLRGGDLKELLQSGPCDLDTTVRIMEQICDALAEAHRQGVIHRDIKPSNILLDESKNAYLTDFGIAKNLNREATLSLEDAVIGSPRYISPEQLKQEPVSPQTDIYSLGLVLYELLTGEPPFTDESVVNLMIRQLNDPLPLVHEQLPQVPTAVDDVIQRATAKQPDDRFSDSIAFKEALHAVFKTTDVKAGPLLTENMDPLKHNIPLQISPFIGRERELAALDSLFQQPETRLISVVGPGGMGKTRLAMAFAQNHISNGDTFSDGIFFVPFISSENSDEMLFEIAKSIDLPPETVTGRSPLQQIQDFLQDKNLLLILDNCEHVLNEFSFVVSLLASAPNLKVLTTSRERLQLVEEQVFNISGLTYPEFEEACMDLLTPEHYTAIQFFQACTRRIMPDYEISEGEISPLIELCQMIDGSPLGLELASSWMDCIQLPEIVHEIKQNFTFLESDLRNIPDRHRSMYAVFQSTWQRLNLDEQEVMGQLAVFRGNFSLEAATNVAKASRRILANLIRKYIVKKDPQNERYSIHELFRQFAEKQIASQSSTDNNETNFLEQARDYHSEYYCNLLQVQGKELKGANQIKALEVLNVDLPNIRAAWQWATKRKNLTLLHKSLEGHAIFYYLKNYDAEAEKVFRITSEKTESFLTSESIDKPDYILLLVGLWLWQAAFSIPDIIPSFSEKIKEKINGLSKLGINTDYETALLLGILTRDALVKRMHRKAIQLSKERMHLYKDIKDNWGLQWALRDLGRAAEGLGDYEQSDNWFNACLSLNQEQNNTIGEAQAILELASNAHKTGNLQKAESYYKKGLNLLLEIGDEIRYAAWLGFYANNFALQGKFKKSDTIRQSSIERCRRLGNTNLIFIHTTNGIVSKLLLNEYDQVQVIAQECLKTNIEETVLKNSRKGDPILSMIGAVEMANYRYSQANELFQESITILHELKEDAGRPHALFAISHLLTNHPSLSKPHLVEALAVVVNKQCFLTLLWTLPGAALYFSKIGDYYRAVTLWSLAKQQPYIANGRWFEDVIGKHLVEASSKLSQHDFSRAEKQGLELDVWETAVSLLNVLQDEFSPNIPHNLPQSTTVFVGRASEMATLTDYIADPLTRLVTILGPGGIGKTRLALSLAKQELGGHQFPDGVFFVPLAAIQEPAYIVQAIADALDFPIQGGAMENRTPQNQLCGFLKNKQMLLLLDNWEHLLPGVALVTDILQSAPQLQIIATSRERLHLREEQLYPITGLALPDIGESVPTEETTAVSLFLQCAHRVLPAFTATQAMNADILQICRHVEGMPLAIELAAAWVDVLSTADIAMELEKNLDLLTSDVNNIPDRHRSVQAMFNASWQRLSAEERGIFSSLSIFRGGFTRSAAEAVAGANLPVLTRLVHKSLVQVERENGRYHLHELLRQYGAEQLSSDPATTADVLDRHATYYCRRLQALLHDLRGNDQQAALEEIEQDHENIRMAWNHAVDHFQPENLAAAMESLGLYYNWSGPFQEGQAAFRKVAAACADQPDKHLVLHGTALTWQAQFIRILGDMETGRELVQQSFNQFDQADAAGLDTRRGRASAFWVLGCCTADTTHSIQLQEKSLVLYREIGDLLGIAHVLGSIADTGGAENLEMKKAMVAESLAIRRRIGDQRGIAFSLWTQAQHAAFEGRYEESIQQIKESMTILKQISDRTNYALAHHRLASSFAHLGQIHKAATVISRGCQLIEELGLPRFHSFMLLHKAALLVDSGQHAKAQRILRAHEEQLSTEEFFPLQRHLAQNKEISAKIAIAQGRFSEAAPLLSESLKLMELSPQPTLLSITHALFTYAACGQNDLETAQEHLVQSLKLALQERIQPALLTVIPAATLLILKRQQFAHAFAVYAVVDKEPFIQESHWIQGVVGKPLAEARTACPPEVLENVVEADGVRDGWETAVSLLHELQKES